MSSLLGRVAARVLGAVFLTAFCGPAVAAQAVPDFYRGGVGWTLADGKNFLPPPPGTPGAAGPIGNHPQYPSFGNQSGQLPTKRIGNDTHPFLLPWAATQMRELREKLVAGAVPYDPAERCWPPGVPSIITFPIEPMYILQTPTEVIMLYQRGQIARHIYLNRPHSPNVKPSWHGESVGHYEGDTLVVDTIGLDTRSFVEIFNVPHTDRLHVIERYRITDQGLQVVFTVEDPGTFTTSWSAMKVHRPSTATFEESICVDGAADRFNAGLRPPPEATRADF
jgi:hypothetical protein